MPLTLELLEKHINLPEALCEVTWFGFTVNFKSSVLECRLNPEGSVKFNYTYDETVFYQTQSIGTDEDLVEHLKGCRDAMTALDNIMSPKETCECCGYKTDEQRMIRCSSCRKDKCLDGCAIESEGICQCCFSLIVGASNPNDNCAHCLQHNPSGEVFHPNPDSTE